MAYLVASSLSLALVTSMSRRACNLSVIEELLESVRFNAPWNLHCVVVLGSSSIVFWIAK